MARFHHKTIKIVSIITLAAFALTNTGMSYAFNQPSNLRRESIAEANGGDKEIAGALSSSTANAAPSPIKIITDAEKQVLASQMREWLVQAGLVEALNSAGIDFTFLVVSSLGHYGKGLTYMADVDIALKYRYKNSSLRGDKNIRDIIQEHITGIWEDGMRPEGSDMLGMPFVTFFNVRDALGSSS